MFSQKKKKNTQPGCVAADEYLSNIEIKKKKKPEFGKMEILFPNEPLEPG